jgi:uncharacterized lipoprotein YehR (DUF1307 family)
MKTTKNYLIAIILSAIVAFMLTSCGNSLNINNNKKSAKTISTDSTQIKSETYLHYGLPLPVELFKWMKSNNLDYNSMYMHSLKEKDKYFTNTQRALSLGLYSADLAYAAVYGQSQLSVDYYIAAIDLAKKLEIQDGYNSETLDLAYKHINNNDSLSQIIHQSYLRTCSSLESDDMENVFPLIIIGSWIESMEILVKNIQRFPDNQKLGAQFANQMADLEKLLQLLNDNVTSQNNSNSHSEINGFIKNLEELNLAYKQIASKGTDSYNSDKFSNVFLLIGKLKTALQ